MARLSSLNLKQDRFKIRCRSVIEAQRIALDLSVEDLGRRTQRHALCGNS